MKKLFLIVLLISNLFGFAQKIDKSKKELNSSSSQSNTKTTSSSQSSASKSYRNNAIADAAGNAFFDVAGEILWGVFKYGLIGDYKNEDHLSFDMTSHPFDNQCIGNYCESDSISKKSFRLDIENQFLYNTKDLLGNHLNVKIRPIKYFYLTTDYYQLFEYNEFTNKSDNLSLFQFNFAYDRLRFENFNLGWTIGATYIGSGVNAAGFSYGVNAEYFLDDKISFLVDKKWSSINNQPVNSFKIDGKYHKKNYFFSLGFENLKIATPTYNFIAIGAGIYF